VPFTNIEIVLVDDPSVSVSPLMSRYLRLRRWVASRRGIGAGRGRAAGAGRGFAVGRVEHRRPRDTGGTLPGRSLCVWNVATPSGSGCECRSRSADREEGPTPWRAQDDPRMTREATGGLACGAGAPRGARRAKRTRRRKTIRVRRHGPKTSAALSIDLVVASRRRAGIVEGCGA
jgi:hypothetical protein